MNLQTMMNLFKVFALWILPCSAQWAQWQKQW